MFLLTPQLESCQTWYSECLICRSHGQRSRSSCWSLKFFLTSQYPWIICWKVALVKKSFSGEEFFFLLWQCDKKINRDHIFSRGIKQRSQKILSFKVLTKLGTKHPWVKGNQVCSNEGLLQNLVDNFNHSWHKASLIDLFK